MEVRPAAPEEAPVLTELALRSKAYWGYDAAFMEACRPELTVRPEDLDRLRVTVAAEAGRPVGFYALAGDAPEGEIWFLFVEPGQMRTGVGRRLWTHAVTSARSLGMTRLRIEADPGAVPFYRAMGAVAIGEAPSQSIPGRNLPLLLATLGTAEDRPLDPTPIHTAELPPTPQRERTIPATAWIEAPRELVDLGADIGHPLVTYKRRIGRWLLWRAGPAARGDARYMAVAADDLSTRHTFRLHPDGRGEGVGPHGVTHRRFRAWKEALRDDGQTEASGSAGLEPERGAGGI